jgi:sphingolipid 4-desaturase/C4-monooxygenase
MITHTDFLHSTTPEPHRTRTRQILKAHPDIKHLIGQKNPATFAVIIGCVALLVGLAWLVRGADWWVVVAAAWFVGAFPAHTLFVCIHEAAHNLIFRKPTANTWAGIFANLPTVLPTAIMFRSFHLKHHSFQGVHELDTDLPDWYEAKLIKNYALGKAVWLLLFPIFQGIRTLRARELAVLDKWTILNVVVQLAFDVLVVVFFGWKALIFLTLCLFFSVGLHPLGARWIQEHYLVLDPNQETYSYYGPLNGPNLNVGFHNEHHDFPSVPWNKLPQLRTTAPEFYDTLKYHTSYIGLFFRFLFDQEISLFSRIVRQERGQVSLADQSKPDLELVQG